MSKELRTSFSSYSTNDIHLFENYRAWDKDRYMSPDIILVKNLLKDEKIWNAAKLHMEKYHTSQVHNFARFYAFFADFIYLKQANFS